MRCFSPSLLAALLLFFNALGCGEDEGSKSIGTSVSGPVDVAVDASGDVFYALNAESNHRYSSGSILLLSKEGEKLSSIETPRMGKRLIVSGNDMLALFDQESGDFSSSTFLLYDITDPRTPMLKKHWTMPSCNPINAAMVKGYNYFAIMCQSGKLVLGELKTPREDSTIAHVRTYPGDNPHGALYLDAKRQLLFLFVTIFNRPSSINQDTLYEDKYSYDQNSKVIPDSTANDIPDSIELSKSRMLDIKENTHRFQFLVFDIKKSVQEGMTLKEYQEVRTEEARWLHFNLTNYDGTPDTVAGFSSPDLKYYRTNFGEAQPDPIDPNVFYLAHRGLGKPSYSEHANSVVKVTIVGDPRKDKLLQDYLKFERIYGFKGPENDEKSYVSSFAFGNVEGYRVLFVNNNRDLVAFDSPRFSMSAAVLAPENMRERIGFARVSSDSMADAYGRFAVGAGGVFMTSAYFNHTLVLFKFELNDKITHLKTIR